MQHLINEPIEAEQLEQAKYHLKENGLKLCFLYHRWLSPGYKQRIYTGGIASEGICIHCEGKDSLFKCEIVFESGQEALKIYNIEQVVRVKRYAQEQQLTENKAAMEWIKLHAKNFYEEK